MRTSSSAPHAPAAPPTTTRGTIARLAMIGGLYSVAVLGIVGGYVAAIVLAASAIQLAWGWEAAIAATGLCLVLTAILAMIAARVILNRMDSPGMRRHRWRRQSSDPTQNGSPSFDEGADDTDSPERSPSLSRAVAQLVAEKVPVEAWVGVASFLAATCVAIGPVRLIRIGLRLALYATEPRPKDANSTCERTSSRARATRR